MKYIEFISLNLLEFDSNGILSRLRIVDIADPMRGKVGMPVLVVWYFELSARDIQVSPSVSASLTTGSRMEGYTPFI